MLERSVLNIVRTKPTKPQERPLPVLEGCPFCNSRATYHQSQSHTAGHGLSGDSVGVICTKCPANIMAVHYAGHQVKERKISTADQWNRRESCSSALSC